MTVVPSDARRRRWGPLRAIVPWILPVVAVVAWWFASAHDTSPFYPPLETIMRSFQQTWLFSHVGADVVPSLERLFAGYGIAVVVGIGLGSLFGRVPLLLAAFNPALQFCRSLPATALVPVGVVLMGIGDEPKIILIAFVSVFPIMLNTIDGVRNVDPMLEDVSRSFRLSRRQRVFQVQLPAAAPQIVAGLRIALSVAFVMMVVTELVAATNGIGYVTLQAQQDFQIPLMWAGVLLLGIFGVVLNGAFVLLERRVLHWYDQGGQK